MKTSYAAAIAVVLLVVGLAVGYFAAPPSAQPATTVTVGGATVTQTVRQTVTYSAAQPIPSPGGKIWVPIMNKFMTFDEIVAEIKKEGKVTVADWTYWGLIDTYFKPSFEKYVKDKYGVDVTIDILGTQEAKGGFIYQLEAAKAAGMPAPYDAMHIELNFLPDAIAKGLAEPFLPSPLVPNLAFVDSQFVAPYLPYGVQFQQHAFITPVVNLKECPWFKNWKDYADPRLKGKVTLWSFTDNGFWTFLAMEADALGYDYKNPDQMKKAIEWVAKNVHPNVLKYTSDEAEIIELSEKNITWITSYWCCSPEMEQAAGNTWLGSVLLEPHMASLHGVAWVPTGCSSPLLGQIYVDYLLSPEFQYPDINGPGFKDLSPKEAKKLWAGMTEGPLGPYYEQFIPDWWGGEDNYFKVYPHYQDVKRVYLPLDWAYITEQSAEWIKYYQSLIGG